MSMSNARQPTTLVHATTNTQHNTTQPAPSTIASRSWILLFLSAYARLMRLWLWPSPTCVPVYLWLCDTEDVTNHSKKEKKRVFCMLLLVGVVVSKLALCCAIWLNLCIGNIYLQRLLLSNISTLRSEPHCLSNRGFHLNNLIENHYLKNDWRQSNIRPASGCMWPHRLHFHHTRSNTQHHSPSNRCAISTCPAIPIDNIYKLSTNNSNIRDFLERIVSSTLERKMGIS